MNQYLDDPNYPSIQASPIVNPTLNAVSRILRGARDFGDKAQIPDWVPLIGDQGVGELFLGNSPEEVEQWSYGNSPFTSSKDRSGTGSLIPNLKSNRRQSFADAAMLGVDVLPGAGFLAKATHGMPVGLSTKPVKPKITTAGSQAVPELTGRKLSSALRKNGVPISNGDEAASLWSQGKKIYAFHEMDGQPFLVNDLETLGTYAPDQLLMLPSSGAVKKPKKGAISDVFGDEDSYEEALTKALRGDHLKRTDDGKYVGGPADLVTPQKLASNRGYADQKVKEGAFNADWYDRSTEAAKEISGYDPAIHGWGTDSPEGAMASLFSRGGAAYSPQATPDYQVNAILKQHNAKVLNDEDLFPKTGAQGRNVSNAYEYNPDTGMYDISPEKIRLGKKTGSYGDATDSTVDPLSLYKTANDIWHGRVMGYGKNFKRGFTPQEHGFLTGENMLLADRANKGSYGADSLGEDFLWTPRGAQAATWGGERLAQYSAKQQKAIAKALKAGKKPPTEKSVEELTKMASLGIDDAIPNRIANQNYEFITGENVNHLKGLNKADDATRQEYSDMAADAFLLDGNRDPIFDAYQMFQKPTVKTQGSYLNSAGVLETNPGLSARPLVSLTNSDLGLTAGGKPKRGGGQISATENKALSNAALLRSYLLGQEGVATNKVTQANTSMKAFEKNGWQYLPKEGEDLNLAVKAFEDAGLNAVHDGTYVTAGRFENDLPAKTVQAAGKKIAKSGDFGGEFVPGRFESTLEEPKWTKNQGTGETTRDLLSRLMDDPEYQVKNFDKKLSGEKFKNSVGNLNRVDEEFSKKSGMPVREDLMLARKIISESGVQGLIDYVKKTGGKGLPAALVAPGGMEMFLSDEGLQE
jgi:hypothetical protein